MVTLGIIKHMGRNPGGGGVFCEVGRRGRSRRLPDPFRAVTVAAFPQSPPPSTSASSENNGRFNQTTLEQ